MVMRVNMSGRQIASGDLVSMIVETLEETGIEPAKLCLEITETVLMGDAAASLVVLQQLGRLGVGVAVDDFGTGYSSLSYLKQFPADVLKIDRGFIGGLGLDPSNTAIVGSIIALANAMGLDVVAEGVESQLQVDQLLMLGCRRAQGWLFGKAMPRQDIEEVLVKGVGWGKQTLPHP